MVMLVTVDSSNASGGRKPRYFGPRLAVQESNAKRRWCRSRITTVPLPTPSTEAKRPIAF